MLKRLTAYIGEYKKQTLLAPLMIVGEVSLEVSIPVLMANIVNIGIETRDVNYIVKTGVLMILMALVSLLFGALAARFSSTAGAGFAKNLRSALFNKVQDYSFSNIDKFNTASLITRLTTDVTNAQQIFMMSTRMAVRSPMMLVLAIIMAVSINAELALVYALAVPLLAVMIATVMYIAHPRFMKMLKALDEMNARVQENLMGIRVVKAFVREKYENERFKITSNNVRDMALSAERLMVFIMPLMQLVMFACVLSITWFGGQKIIAGNMQTGDLMGFITYTSQILISLMMLGMLFIMFVMSRASIMRILELLDEQPDIVSPENACMQVQDGSIVFENVSFRYREGSGKDALSDINLSINPGETIGIIGATGSAKSTLVKLIPRLYDVCAGRVLVGGKDVREYDLKTLRDAVCLTLQNNVLFSGTIIDNLRWGNENATMDEIAAACRVAQAQGFIMDFKGGFETDLGQGGVNVSGGQKQRLCIARALLKRPKVIIFDDSTSAIDTATDKKIRDGLKKELSHMTTLIIAQRVASVMEADRIIVMESGGINACGTHDELLATNEIYKDIYSSQLKGVAENV